MFMTFRYRLKDARAVKALEAHRFAANQVWNFCVATQREAQRRRDAGRSVRRLTLIPTREE